MNWLVDGFGVGAEIWCAAKVRYNSPPAPALARRTDDDELTVTFDEPVAAITPGQAVVCYEGERLVGGGWIENIKD